MAIDIWNAPIMHLDEKGVPFSNASLAEIFENEETPVRVRPAHQGMSSSGEDTSIRKRRFESGRAKRPVV